MADMLHIRTNQLLAGKIHIKYDYYWNMCNIHVQVILFNYM